MNRKLLLAMLIPVALPTVGMAQPDNSEVAAQSVNMEHMIDLFTVGGRPLNQDSTRKVMILVNHGYVVGYSEDRRNPLWSAYRASEIKGTAEPVRYERAKFFFADSRSTAAVDGRTFGGGFDRGHMTPNFAIVTQYGSLAQLETFFMTNMCPQRADLNQGSWVRLEQFVIAAAQELDHVFVISGPIFGNSPGTVSNGSNRMIQIPDAFYMILVDTNREYQTFPEVNMIAYLFPQDTPRNADFTDRSAFGVSINEIEEATLLDFFPTFGQLFSDWETREGQVEMQHWDIN